MPAGVPQRLIADRQASPFCGRASSIAARAACRAKCAPPGPMRCAARRKPCGRLTTLRDRQRGGINLSGNLSTPSRGFQPNCTHRCAIVRHPSRTQPNILLMWVEFAGVAGALGGAALFALVHQNRRLRRELSRLAARTEELADRNWELKDSEER